MSRRRHRTRGRALLWDDTPSGDVQLGEVRDNPRTRSCSWCHARPGEPCVSRTRHDRRRPISGYHDARTPQEDR